MRLRKISALVVTIICGALAAFAINVPTAAKAETSAADEIVAQGVLAELRYDFAETTVNKDGFIAVSFNVKDIKNTADAFAYMRISLYNGETEYPLALPAGYNLIKIMPESFSAEDFAATGGSGRVTADRIKCYTTDGKAYSVANKKTSGTTAEPQSYYVIKKGFDGTFYIYLGDFLTESVAVDGISFTSDMTHYATYDVREIFYCEGKNNENKRGFTPESTKIINNALTRNGKKIVSETVGTSVKYAEKGETAEIEVKAESGWYFYSVKSNGSDVKNQLVNGVYRTKSATLTEFSAKCLEYAVSVDKTVKNGTLSYYKNGDKTIAYVKAVPDNGYKLVKITANGREIEGTEIVINGNIEISAVFEKTEIKCEVAAGSENMGSAEKTVNADGSVTIKVRPTDARYSLKSVTLNGKDITEEFENGEYTITEYREDITIIATFGERRVELAETENGSLVYRKEGEILVIKATPNAGCYLYSLTVNGKPVNADENGEYRALFDKDYEVSAEFREYKSSFTANYGGEITPNKSEDGKTVEYSIKTEFGYTVSEAYLNGEKISATDGKVTAANDKDNYLAVIFESLVSVTAEGNGYADYTLDEAEESVEFTIVADDGYEIAEISLNGETITPKNGKYKCKLLSGAYLNVKFTKVEKKPETNDNEKGGCNSALTAGLPVATAAAIIGAAILLRRRKDESEN